MSASNMDIVAGIRNYVDKMCSSIDGVKALILDADTASIVSMAYSQSDVLAKDIFLLGRLETLAERDPMMHCKAICFVKPTQDSLRTLAQLLRGTPKFGEWHLFFSNTLRADQLSQLADADAEHEAVKQVQEFFADVQAINSNLFSLNDARLRMDAACDGIISMLLALKKRPHVRFSKGSPLAQQLASDLSLRLDQEASLFDFRASRTPLLLILDRREDPVTPLLNQWTYQAMTHELIGLQSNRVKVGDAEFVMAESQDQFFASYMYANFGDLGEAVRELVEEYQSTTNQSASLNTMEDIQNFVDKFPHLKSQSTSVSKHVSVVSELSKLVNERNLFEVSAIEQDLACQEDHSSAIRRVKQALESPKTSRQDKLRLVLLYALRYQRSSSNRTSELIEMLSQSGVEADKLSAVAEIINYCAQSVKNGELFGNKNILGVFRSNMTRNVRGVENVFTQHEPLVVNVAEQALKGKLKDATFPYSYGHSMSKEKYTELIVFIVGGATFEEAAALKRLEMSNTGSSILLGGNTVHNMESFLDEEVIGDKVEDPRNRLL